MTNDYIVRWLSGRSERGQDLAEYALLVALIALILIVAITLLSNQISLVFSTIASNLTTW